MSQIEIPDGFGDILIEFSIVPVISSSEGSLISIKLQLFSLKSLNASSADIVLTSCIASETRVCAVFIDIVNIYKVMQTNILKKIFVKLIKALGFEIIDQNQFKSPTLNKELNEQLSNINKSIVLPLGEVNLSRKISDLLIIFRTNSNIEIWDQNKKRIFEKDKIEYVKRSLNSLIKSIKLLKNNYLSLNVNLIILDDRSKEENLIKIKNILEI